MMAQAHLQPIYVTDVSCLASFPKEGLTRSHGTIPHQMDPEHVDVRVHICMVRCAISMVCVFAQKVTFTLV